MTPCVLALNLPCHFALVVAVLGWLVEEAKAQKAAEAKAAGHAEKPAALRVRTNDVTDMDCDTIKNMTKFPAHRRIPVVTVEPNDDLSVKVGEMLIEQSPFIIRPKRGKTLLKLLDVLWPRSRVCQMIRQVLPSTLAYHNHPTANITAQLTQARRSQESSLEALKLAVSEVLKPCEISFTNEMQEFCKQYNEELVAAADKGDAVQKPRSSMLLDDTEQNSAITQALFAGLCRAIANTGQAANGLD